MATPTLEGTSGGPVMSISPPTAWMRKSYPARCEPAPLPKPVIEAYTTPGFAFRTDP